MDNHIRDRKAGCSVVFFLIQSALSLPLQASLGDSHESVGRGLDRSAASETVEKHDGYQIYNLDYPEHCIREYVSGSGIVFAVAWNGLSQPDLSALLGKYFQEYVTSRNAVSWPARFKPLAIHSKNIIAQHSGHMRNIHGKAYIPALLPPQCPPGDIQ